MMMDKKKKFKRNGPKLKPSWRKQDILDYKPKNVYQKVEFNRDDRVAYLTGANERKDYRRVIAHELRTRKVNNIKRVQKRREKLIQEKKVAEYKEKMNQVLQSDLVSNEIEDSNGNDTFGVEFDEYKKEKAEKVNIPLLVTKKHIIKYKTANDKEESEEEEEENDGSTSENHLMAQRPDDSSEEEEDADVQNDKSEEESEDENESDSDEEDNNVTVTIEPFQKETLEENTDNIEETWGKAIEKSESERQYEEEIKKEKGIENEVDPKDTYVKKFLTRDKYFNEIGGVHLMQETKKTMNKKVRELRQIKREEKEKRKKKKNGIVGKGKGVAKRNKMLRKINKKKK